METRARTSHLFTPFPETIRYDMAFHDRWHAYLPGWELPKMQPEYFTNHLGFIVDYMAEIFRELRKRNYTDAYEHHFRLEIMSKNGIARPLLKLSLGSSNCSILMVSVQRRS